MGMLMIKCPRTGHAIPTGIATNGASFRSTPVFFARTLCPICRTSHEWFAKEAWVDEPRPAWHRKDPIGRRPVDGIREANRAFSQAARIS